MSETVIVNVAIVFRSLLIGGILLVIPHVTRKGLLFGAYIGEELAEGDAARRILRRWHLGCIALAVLALVVGIGISEMGHPMAGNLTCVAILVLGAGVLYLAMYRAARKLAPPGAARQAETAAAPLEQGEPRGVVLAKITLCLCIVAGVATVVYAAMSYEALPERMPTHFGPTGEADAWSDRSMAVVLLVPVMNLVLCPFIALFALLTARAKRSIRGGSGGGSIEAQSAFRTAVANMLSGTALFTCALLTFISVQIIRIGLSEGRSIGPGILVVSVAMLVFMLGYLIRILVVYGQGGALLETGSTEAPLTNGLADNTHWTWGIFYVNKDDPSILVEKRFGIGYTINFGNPKACLIFGTFLVLTLGLVAFAAIAKMG